MSVRQDQVQLRVDFITDESRQLAKTLNDTQRYTSEINAANAAIKKYNVELAKTNVSEQRRGELTRLVAAEQRKIVEAERAIVAEGKKIENLDLRKVAPAQLEQRLRQIRREMNLIADQTSPAFAQLKNELDRVNGRLKEIRGTVSTIQRNGSEGGGGILGSIVGRAAVAIGAVQATFAAIQGMFSYLTTAVSESREARAADAALLSRIDSTAGAAGRSLEELASIADELEGKTLFSAEQIKKGEEILLTFTNIRDEVLDQTIPAMLDLSTVFGQDVSSSAVQLGKALNDPIQGVTALGRVGVTFSDQQKALIKTFVETNRLADAQAVILDELRTQVGGAAADAATAEKGGLRKLEVIYGRITENIGTLIDKGLNRLAPVMETILTVVDKAVSSFLSGEAATGKFATAANILAGVMQGVGFVIDAVGKIVQVWVDGADLFGRAFDFVSQKATGFVQSLSEIPALAPLFGVMRAQVVLLNDAFRSWGATVAGVKAAITDLFTNFGRNVGNAYAEARDAVLQDEARNAAEQARDDRQGAQGGSRKRGGFSVGGFNPEELEKRRKSFEKIRDDGFDRDLKAIEAQQKRAELLAEIQYTQGVLNEREYHERLGAAAEQGYANQLELYRKYGKDQTEQALSVQLELERIAAARRGRGGTVATLDSPELGGVTSNRDTTTANRLGVAGLTVNPQLAALKSRFEQALISEQEYNLRSLELKQQLADAELRILQDAASPQWEAIRTKEEEKKRIEEEIGQARIENERRLEQLRQRMTQESLATAQEFFSTVANLLSEDEASRKKYASAIKAFQIGEVTVAGITEVARVWSNAAQFGPLGPIIGAVQTALAVARTAVAISKIQGQKFAGGGYTGQGFGRPDDTGYKPAGVVHEGEYVSPKWQVQHPVTGPIIAALDRHRLRGYADGGFVSYENTPVGDYSLPTGSTGGSTQDLTDAVNAMRSAVLSFPRTVTALLSFQSLETAQTDVGIIRERAVI